MAIKKEKGVAFVDNLTSGDILKLLAKRHAKDLFIDECKNGSTYYPKVSLRKFDAWVLQRTWSPITTIGYEIKVSRQDFENDQKWVDYIPLCHLFSFVCPAGLIRATDLPVEVGLIWVSSTGNLHVKRHATRREPDMSKLKDLLFYALMCRSVIVGDMYSADEGLKPATDRLQLKRSSVEEAETKNELAYFIRGHVRRMADEYQKKDRELRDREDNVKRFAQDLARLGITWDPSNHDWQDTSRVEVEITALKSQLGENTLWEMENIGQRLAVVAADIRAIRKKGKDG